MIPNSFLEEHIQAYFEAKKNNKKKPPVTETLKNQLNEKAKTENFDDLFSEAAKILQQKTYRHAGKIPGGLAFSADDVIFILKEIRNDKEFLEGVTTPKELADKAFQLCYDILAIANGYVESVRADKDYSPKLAYETSDNERTELVRSIKNTLKAIYLLTKKRIKVEASKDSLHTLVMRKVISYIMGKSTEILKDLDSITEDINSSNAKLKAEATANLKNLKAHFDSEKPVEVIKKAFDVIKKNSGNESLIWPSLNVNIVSGDEYQSLFKYLDMYAKGSDKSHATKWVSQFKNKAKAEIRRKILLDADFRKKLKIAVRAGKVDSTHGEEQTISNLQKIAKNLLKENPEFKEELSKEGIKHTAIDEVVGLLATFIKTGALKVKVE